MTKCTLCKRNEPFFRRTYSGENLCKRCFCRSVEDKVRKTISKYKMFGFNDNFMIAVSGGKDSVTLLHIMKKIEKAFPNVTMSVGTVDEGIKDYRDEALLIARKNCQKLGIDHIVISFKELFGYGLDEIVHLTQKKEQSGLTPCSYCGVLRRKALNILAREAGVKKLVTAHSLDDETQTMLLNVIHGDPMRIARLKPVLNIVHPKFVPRVKPLCMVPEKEVVLYAYLKGIKFQCFNCPYAQAALRNDLRNFLNRLELKHAGTLFTVFRSMEKLHYMAEEFAEEVELNECRICGEPSISNLCRPCHILQELKVL